jgi:hypothetical protein
MVALRRLSAVLLIVISTWLSLTHATVDSVWKQIADGNATFDVANIADIYVDEPDRPVTSSLL